MENVQFNADYQRIRQVMEHLNFSSDKKFADTIGVSPQNLYDIKAGKKGLTQFLADKIIEHYPQFRIEYLVLGSGDMLCGSSVQTIQGHGNHHNTVGMDSNYIAHLEAEIESLRKEKEELWQMVQKLVKQ